MTTIEAPIAKGNNVPMSVVTTETDTKGESDKNNNMPKNPLILTTLRTLVTVEHRFQANLLL